MYFSLETICTKLRYDYDKILELWENDCGNKYHDLLKHLSSFSHDNVPLPGLMDMEQ